MSRKVRLIVAAGVTLAVAFGLAPAWFGEKSAPAFSILHVFLFNLFAGGFLLVTRLSDRRDFSPRSETYLLACLLFLAGAVTDFFPLTAAAALGMGALLESIRWRRFSVLPYEFLLPVPVSRKFEQAALLCLSLGLFICAAALLNRALLHWFSIEKLDLHVFFLGFSFPISLIAFAELFARYEQSDRPPARALSEFCFWALNLGVIVFFIFIVAGNYALQLLMAQLLFTVVIAAVFLHRRLETRDQTWQLSASALAFLTLGSLTGITYILELWTDLAREPGYLLSLHSSANLFGWNLTWMLLAVRAGDFPLRLPVRPIIALHWTLVLLLPLGRLSATIAGLALAVGITLLSAVFLAPTAAGHREIPPA